MTFAIRRTQYKTFDGAANYIFDFAYVDNSWRIYIVEQPSYGNRSSSAVVVHRLVDRRGHYICWDRPITTLDDAKGVASMWADCTQHYIRTGQFQEPPGRDQSRIFDWSNSASWALRNVPGNPEAAAGRTPAAGPILAQPEPRRGVLRRLFGSEE